MGAQLAISGTTLFVAGAAMAAAFAQGLSGFAFSLVALSLWLHVLPPKVAGPLAITCGLISQCLMVVQLRRHFRYDLLWPFLVGGLIGTPFGVFLLDYIDPQAFRTGVGVFLLVYSTYMLFMPPMIVTAGGRLADGGIGLIGGVMGGLAGLSGAIPTPWCLLRGWDKDTARSVYQPFNVAIQAMALTVLLVSGEFTSEVGTYALFSLPAMAVGVWLGWSAYSRISDAQFRRLVLWLLLVAGISLVW